MNDVFSTVEAKNGRIMYRKNGRIISKQQYDEEFAPPPAGMVEPSVAELHNYDSKLKRACIFCGQPGHYQRMANTNTYFLCAGHYHEKTLGQIVQKAKELDGRSIQ